MAAPRRIVSLVPSLTELLAALGLDAETVGLTRFCVHPPDWKKRKAIVGGTKTVDVARTLALAPDLVLATREENVREQVEALATAAPVLVTDVDSVASALSAIREIGRATDRADAADALADRIAAAFDALPAVAPQRAVYLIWRDPWMTVGHDTYIHSVMAAGGLVNAFGERARYPTVTPDEIAAARPDVVLLSSEPYPFAEKHLAEAQALAPDAHIRLVDGEAFSWYGPRMLHTPAALADLRRRIRG